MDRHNSSDLRSLIESYQTLTESAIDMPAANTPAHVDPKPAEPFPKDRVKRDKAEAPKSMKKEDEDLMAAYHAVYDRQAEVVEEEEVAEAMSSYDRNRKRAAQRAADRNAARAAGKTGVVPGVGYVTPRKERETYVDSAGTTRHKSGAKMEELEATGLFSDSEIEAILKDAEQLDEISSRRLNSYIKKAEKQGEKNIFGDKETSTKGFRRLGNVSKAKSKLGQNKEKYNSVTPHTKIKSTELEKKKTQTEEAELDIFDLILEYLAGRGFPEEDAMQLMATMDDEKREKVTSEAVSWDKYGRPKDPKARAEAERKAAEMRAKDKASGRRRYGHHTGYAKKEWDEWYINTYTLTDMYDCTQNTV